MVRLLFFAQIQEEIGKKELCIQATGKTIKSIIEEDLKAYKIDELLENVMVAVNEEYADEYAVVYSGDTVAFIPPVSGG